MIGKAFSKTSDSSPSLKGASLTLGKFRVRFYQPGDEEAIISAWEKAFGKPFPLQVWRWKFSASPWGFSALVCLSGEGLVAAHYSGQYQKVWFEGRSLRALHLVDVFTHPAYRWAVGGKKGLLVQMARTFFKTHLKNCPFEDWPALEARLPKADFAWGLPGLRHFKLGQLAVAYQRQEAAPLYLEKTFPPRKLLPFFKKLAFIDSWPPDLEDLWEAHRRFLSAGLEKTAAYLTWRYRKHPERAYQRLLLSQGRTSRALLITYKTEGRVILMDFLAAEPTFLLEALERLSRVYPGQKVCLWLSGSSPFKEVFLEAGWRPQKEPLGIVPGILGYTPDFSRLKSSFHWTIGDADLF